VIGVGGRLVIWNSSDSVRKKNVERVTLDTTSGEVVPQFVSVAVFVTVLPRTTCPKSSFEGTIWPHGSGVAVPDLR